MKFTLNKKKLKTLSSNQQLNAKATPNVGGGYEPSYLDCAPTNRNDCQTGVISCYNGRDCVFTNRWYNCD
ncbi:MULTISPECIES: hypothetical protein [Pseudoalteromonas]|uniref:Uncharacterized protein n=1 Tax=Pseudoalteromonas rubra TaxID=43658 RepID=A0A5S3X4Z3_9GAMM|nr:MULTISPECIES: hypothetical protein [Pseudoalteromonas]AZZ95725.1 hypothetical protein ELR70_00500 [Pseudoalteromonas sp. R3]MCO7189068.1 hypothetical protein [Pseudoalteromonas sp. XMcav2-N]TMP39642.1 hypothetical protein CWB98_03380 [Pseudoalteromonas rubra]